MTGGNGSAAGLDEAPGRQIAADLGLEPLDREGGLFRRTVARPGFTAIYYLLVGNDFSAMHRMRSCDELFLFHAGAPLRMLLLDSPKGREEWLGPDPRVGHSPQILVPAGVWQGASSAGAWSLVSTVVVPGFEWADFELGKKDVLSQAFPTRAQRIAELTR